MLNLRRAFTSTKPRPKSTMDPVVPETAGVGRKRSKMFDATAAAPSSARFYQVEQEQYFSAMLDYIMVSALRNIHIWETRVSTGQTYLDERRLRTEHPGRRSNKLAPSGGQRS